jgi:hypothetical protein
VDMSMRGHSIWHLSHLSYAWLCEGITNNCLGGLPSKSGYVRTFRLAIFTDFLSYAKAFQSTVFTAFFADLTMWGNSSWQLSQFSWQTMLFEGIPADSFHRFRTDLAIEGNSTADSFHSFPCGPGYVRALQLTAATVFRFLTDLALWQRSSGQLLRLSIPYRTDYVRACGLTANGFPYGFWLFKNIQPTACGVILRILAMRGQSG